MPTVRSRGLVLNTSSVSPRDLDILLRRCCDGPSRWVEAVKLLTGALHMNVVPSTQAYRTVIDTVGRSSTAQVAVHVVTQMAAGSRKSQHTLFRYLLTTLASQQPSAAMEMLPELERRGMPPMPASLYELIATNVTQRTPPLDRRQAWDTMLAILPRFLARDRVPPTPSVCSSLLCACTASGKWETAVGVALAARNASIDLQPQMAAYLLLSYRIGAPDRWAEALRFVGMHTPLHSAFRCGAFQMSAAALLAQSDHWPRAIAIADLVMQDLRYTGDNATDALRVCIPKLPWQSALKYFERAAAALQPSPVPDETVDALLRSVPKGCLSADVVLRLMSVGGPRSAASGMAVLPHASRAQGLDAIEATMSAAEGRSDYTTSAALATVLVQQLGVGDASDTAERLVNGLRAGRFRRVEKSVLADAATRARVWCQAIEVLGPLPEVAQALTSAGNWEAAVALGVRDDSLERLLTEAGLWKASLQYAYNIEERMRLSGAERPTPWQSTVRSLTIPMCATQHRHAAVLALLRAVEVQSTVERALYEHAAAAEEIRELREILHINSAARVESAMRVIRGNAERQAAAALPLADLGAVARAALIDGATAATLCQLNDYVCSSKSQYRQSEWEPSLLLLSVFAWVLRTPEISRDAAKLLEESLASQNCAVDRLAVAVTVIDALLERAAGGGELWCEATAVVVFIGTVLRASQHHVHRLLRATRPRVVLSRLCRALVQQPQADLRDAVKILTPLIDRQEYADVLDPAVEALLQQSSANEDALAECVVVLENIASCKRLVPSAELINSFARWLPVRCAVLWTRASAAAASWASPDFVRGAVRAMGAQGLWADALHFASTALPCATPLEVVSQIEQCNGLESYIRRIPTSPSTKDKVRPDGQLADGQLADSLLADLSKSTGYWREALERLSSTECQRGGAMWFGDHVLRRLWLAAASRTGSARVVLDVLRYLQETFRFSPVSVDFRQCVRAVATRHDRRQDAFFDAVRILAHSRTCIDDCSSVLTDETVSDVLRACGDASRAALVRSLDALRDLKAETAVRALIMHVEGVIASCPEEAPGETAACDTASWTWTPQALSSLAEWVPTLVASAPSATAKVCQSIAATTFSGAVAAEEVAASWQSHKEHLQRLHKQSTPTPRAAPHVSVHHSEDVSNELLLFAAQQSVFIRFGTDAVVEAKLAEHLGAAVRARWSAQALRTLLNTHRKEVMSALRSSGATVALPSRPSDVKEQLCAAFLPFIASGGADAVIQLLPGAAAVIGISVFQRLLTEADVMSVWGVLHEAVALLHRNRWSPHAEAELVLLVEQSHGRVPQSLRTHPVVSCREIESYWAVYQPALAPGSTFHYDEMRYIAEVYFERLHEAERGQGDVDDVCREIAQDCFSVHRALRPRQSFNYHSPQHVKHLWEASHATLLDAYHTSTAYVARCTIGSHGIAEPSTLVVPSRPLDALQTLQESHHAAGLTTDATGGSDHGALKWKAALLLLQLAAAARSGTVHTRDVAPQQLLHFCRLSLAAGLSSSSARALVSESIGAVSDAVWDAVLLRCSR